MILKRFRSRSRYLPFLCLAVAAFALAAPLALAAEDAQSYIADGKQKAASGDLRGAEIQLRNAVRLKPNDPEIHAELAGIYLKIGNLPAAEAEARAAQQNHGAPDLVDPLLAQVLLKEGKVEPLLQQIKPGNRNPKAESAVRLALGTAHLALREDKDADTLLQDALRLDDQSAGVHIELAHLALFRRDVPGAETELSRARAIAPDDIEITRMEGEILASKGDNDGALQQFQKILATHPDDLGSLINRAAILLRKNDLDAAQKDLDHALKIVPNSVLAAYFDSILLARKGKLKDADEVLSKVSTDFNSFPDGYYMLGAIELAVGETEQAEANLTKYLTRNPTDMLSRQLLATIALKKRDNRHAILYLQPVADAEPANVRVTIALARAYMATGQRNQAVELFQKAAVAQPDNANAQAAAAVMRMRLGDSAEGAKELETLMQSGEGADYAGTALVLTDLQSGKISAAADAAETLVKHDKNGLVAQNLLGIVRLAQRRYPEAVQIFQDLVKKDSNLIQPLRDLAVAYTAMGQIEDATRSWTEVLKKQPGDLDAYRALIKIAADKKDFPTIIDLLTKAQQAAPKDTSPGIQLLEVYILQKDWDKAKAFGRTLEGQFPANGAVIDIVARMRLDSGDTAGALQEYGRLVEAYPNSPVVMQRFAQFQIRGGDQQGARESLVKAVALAPNVVDFMRDLVDFDLKVKGLDAALATARSFAQTQPTVSALLVSGLLGDAKRFDEAIDGLKQAQQKHPSAVLLVRIAELTNGVGKRPAAEAMLESWIKDHNAPYDADPARLELASLYLQDRDDAKAAPLYQAALADRANIPMALNNLAGIYLRKSDPRAAQLAEQAFTLAPSAVTADTLGWALVAQGSASTGLSYLQQASDALPQNIAIQYHMAVALKDTGAKDKALAILEKVVQSDSDFDGKENAKKLLAELQHG
jgi:putative PEP-CTERM system TPR-repeat lipoprotein